MTQHRVVEHFCMRAEQTNRQNAQEPFHKTVCVKVQSIKSRWVAQMTSFWDIKKFTERLRRWSFQKTGSSGDYTPATALGILRAAFEHFCKAGWQLAVRRREVLGHAPRECESLEL